MTRRIAAAALALGLLSACSTPAQTSTATPEAPVSPTPASPVPSEPPSETAAPPTSEAPPAIPPVAWQPDDLPRVTLFDYTDGWLGPVDPTPFEGVYPIAENASDCLLSSRPATVQDASAAELEMSTRDLSAMGLSDYSGQWVTYERDVELLVDDGSADTITFAFGTGTDPMGSTVATAARWSVAPRTDGGYGVPLLNIVLSCPPGVDAAEAWPTVEPLLRVHMWTDPGDPWTTPVERG